MISKLSEVNKRLQRNLRAALIAHQIERRLCWRHAETMKSPVWAAVSGQPHSWHPKLFRGEPFVTRWILLMGPRRALRQISFPASEFSTDRKLKARDAAHAAVGPAILPIGSRKGVQNYSRKTHLAFIRACMI
jgi:hypothetical protein